MRLTSPVGGRDYLRKLVEMTSRFSTQEDCLDYLEWLRWPDGIRCAADDHDAASTIMLTMKRTAAGTVSVTESRTRRCAHVANAK